MSDRKRSARSDNSIAVIGAGIVGLCCALALAEAGQSVTLIDDDADAKAASWGNAGHLAPEQVAPLASLAVLRSAPARWFGVGGPLDVREPWRVAAWMARYLRASLPARYRQGHAALRALLAEAMPAWRDLVDSLEAPELLREQGHIVCWGSRASARRGLGAWRNADIGRTQFQSLSSEARSLLEQTVGHSVVDGIAFTGTGQISDHARLREALHRRLEALGVQRQSRTVSAIEASDDGGFFLHDSTPQAPRFSRVLVCAGVRSVGLMADVGECAPLIAERGYHLHWSDHDWPHDLPPVAFEDRSVIATRFDNGLRLAGFVEFAPRDASPDPRKWTMLERHAHELGLPVRGTPQRWFGARPTLPDYLPAIGESSRCPGLFYAFGHQHLGLTLAPITAQLIAARVTDQATALPLAAFDLARFSAF